MARANGEGSEPRRRKDGLWQSNYTVYIDGKRKLRSVYGRTKNECRKKLREKLAERDGGIVFDTKNLTVAEYLDRWLAWFRVRARSVRTYDDYEYVIRCHVHPERIGRLKLDRLTGAHIDELYAAKLHSGLSSETVLHVHRTLRRAFNQAVRWRMIPRNPVLDATPPPKRKRPATVLSGEQVLQFIERAGTRRLFPLYVLDALTGLRSGEILGLSWEDLSRDAEGPLLRVHRRLLSSSEGVRLVEGTKTGAGMTVRLPELGEAVLRIHRKRQLEERMRAGPAWRETGLIFTTRRGGWIHPNNVSGYLRKDLEAAGLPPVRFHDLRHSLATIMALDGAHVAVVAGMLGHASPTTTLNTYTHFVPGMQAMAVKRLNELFPASLVADLEDLPDLSQEPS
ncbi:site-specific integrase [Rubrobacter calidifluminis]|uniref:site-specific integrase n=1 Tax=Rubrobacter calidifluminis TaxID=1392640 RepID=UPI00235F1634|nr:tyrosine-type recombinase/integrase [Rubrobacter calidifluminis]